MPRKTYREGTLILGSSARAARTLTEDEIRHLGEHAGSYRDFWKAYRTYGIGGRRASGLPSVRDHPVP